MNDYMHDKWPWLFLVCVCMLALLFVVTPDKNPDLPIGVVSAENVSIDPTNGELIACQDIEGPIHFVTYIDPNAGQADTIDLSGIYLPTTLSLNGATCLTLYENRPTAWVDVNDPNCLTDASIRLLASSGRLCRTLHHKWELHFEGGVMTNTDPTGEETRTCLLCGRVERKRLVKSHWTGWEVVTNREVRP